MSRWLRCRTTRSKLSIQNEHAKQGESLVHVVCPRGVSGWNIGWYITSWPRPSKTSSSVLRLPGPSKTYSLSTSSQGRSRRAWLSSSRSFVNFFSSTRCSLRASSHSVCETTLCSIGFASNPRMCNDWLHMLTRQTQPAVAVSFPRHGPVRDREGDPHRSPGGGGVAHRHRARAHPRVVRRPGRDRPSRRRRRASRLHGPRRL